MSLEPVEIPTLLTERLRLRPFRRTDIDDYAAMNADPEVVRYLAAMPAETWDRGRSWRHLAFVVGHWHGNGPWPVAKRGGAPRARPRSVGPHRARAAPARPHARRLTHPPSRR